MCLPENTIRFEVLEDGTISINTGAFGAEVHQSADDFLDLLEEMTGGVRQVEKTREHVHPIAHKHSQQQQARH